MFIHEKPNKPPADNHSTIDWSAVSKSPDPIKSLVNPPAKPQRKPRARVSNDLYNEIMIKAFTKGNIVQLAKEYGVDAKTIYHWRVMIIEKRTGFLYNHLYDSTKEIIKPHVKHMREMRHLLSKEKEQQMNEDQTEVSEPIQTEPKYLSHLKALTVPNDEQYLLNNAAGDCVQAKVISPHLLEFLKKSGIKVYRLSMREI